MTGRVAPGATRDIMVYNAGENALSASVMLEDGRILKGHDVYVESAYVMSIKVTDASVSVRYQSMW